MLHTSLARILGPPKKLTEVLTVIYYFIPHAENFLYAMRFHVRFHIFKKLRHNWVSRKIVRKIRWRSMLSWHWSNWCSLNWRISSRNCTLWSSTFKSILHCYLMQLDYYLFLHFLPCVQKEKNMSDLQIFHDLVNRLNNQIRGLKVLVSLVPQSYLHTDFTALFLLLIYK